VPRAAKPAQRKRRALPPVLALALGSGGFALLLGEIGLRLLGGFDLTSLRLVQRGGSAMSTQQQIDAMADTVTPFLAATLRAGDEIDPEWLRTSPPPIEPPPLLERAPRPQREWLFHYYTLNAVQLRAVWVAGQGLPMFAGIELPETFTVFDPPGGNPQPRYRYPLSRTLPTGLMTNRFGFRGRQLDVDKPDDTVRIAWVGASTTVEAARLPASAPELVEHWLRIWAARRGIQTRFECINAAREAISSRDLRAIVSDEVLPLAVDYVVYYEGKNQLLPETLLRHAAVEGEFTLGQPPAGTLLKAQQDGGATAYSAVARYFDTATRSRQPLGEAEGKPTQHVEFPAGCESGDFPLDRAGEVLALGEIGADLQTIYEAVQAARGQLVLCTFAWLVDDGLTYDPILGEHIKADLDGAYWPLSYGTIRRAVDVQNRFFAAFARQRGLDLIDIAGTLPADPLLYIDAVHHTEMGVRLKAWVYFVALTRILERDLQRQRVPQPDARVDGTHPNIRPGIPLSRRQLDSGG
jgi:hypothetical protein